MNNEYKNLKKSLDEFLAKKREKELGNDRQALIKDVAVEVGVIFRPILEAMAAQARMSRDEIKAVAEDIAARINIPEINIPEIVMPRMPDITVPEPRVNVTVPPIRVPDVIMPDEMNIKGWVNLMGVDLDHPLPVQLRDEKGKVLNLFDGLTQVVGGGGFRRVRIDNPASEPVPITGSLTVAAAASTYVIPGNSEGIVYNSDNPLPVTVLSGGTATSAAAIVDSSGVQYSGSNPVPVVFGASATQGVMWVDSTGVAYEGANPAPITGSVAVTGVTGSIGATILNGEGLARDSWLVSAITASVAAMNVDSTGVGYSGSNPLPITIISTAAAGATGSLGVSVLGSDGLAFGTSKPIPVTMVTGVSASVTANLHDSSGVGYSGSNPLPVTFVTGVSASVNAAIIDSTGVGYSGSNPVPVILVANAASSTVAVGSVAENTSGDGIRPLQTGGLARQTNPTARTDGYVTSFTADDLGRQLVRPIQVRDLVYTAYASKATGSTFGTETTLLASGSGALLDLIYVMATNDSTAATYVELRASTGGTVTLRLDIPANSSIGFNLPVPYNAPFADHTWTVDFPDITGTNCTVSALFTKEV